MVYLPFSQFPLTLTYSIARYILTNNTINKTADFILILLSFLFFYKMLFFCLFQDGKLHLVIVSP